MEMVLVYDGLKEAADKVGMSVEQFKESLNKKLENDPVQLKLKKYRYHLETSYDGFDCYWDSLEKKYIEVHGEKHCEKWQKAHAGEWCTNF